MKFSLFFVFLTPKLTQIRAVIVVVLYDMLPLCLLIKKAKKKKIFRV